LKGVERLKGYYEEEIDRIMSKIGYDTFEKKKEVDVEPQVWVAG
jgi:hypothetical protein